MTSSNHTIGPEDLFPAAAFDIASLDDEIRADQLIGDLLRHFFQDQAEKFGREQETAGRLARGADYFLREFIIAERRENIFRIPPERIRQFAGNWYIVRNLEPNMAELGDILNGVSAFYIWLAKVNRIDTDIATRIDNHCNELDYYQARIEAFWNLEDDGFIAWDQECPFDEKQP